MLIKTESINFGKPPQTTAVTQSYWMPPWAVAKIGPANELLEGLVVAPARQMALAGAPARQLRPGLLTIINDKKPSSVNKTNES